MVSAVTVVPAALAMTCDAGEEVVERWLYALRPPLPKKVLMMLLAAAP